MPVIKYSTFKLVFTVLPKNNKPEVSTTKPGRVVLFSTLTRLENS